MAEDVLTISNPARDKFERYYAEKLWMFRPFTGRKTDWRSNPMCCARWRRFWLVRRRSRAAARTGYGKTRSFKPATTGQFPTSAHCSARGSSAAPTDAGGGRTSRRRCSTGDEKGTPVVMEALIQDITGWEGAVVESFKRLGRARHRLDPEPWPFAGAVTHSLPGGTADLREGRISEILDGAFDDLAHTPDFRRLRGFRGRYNIPKLNFHLYRLGVFEVNLPTPFDFGNGRFSIDPSGRDITLFRPSRRGPDVEWTPVEEWQLPGCDPVPPFQRRKRSPGPGRACRSTRDGAAESIAR